MAPTSQGAFYLPQGKRHLDGESLQLQVSKTFLDTLGRKILSNLYFKNNEEVLQNPNLSPSLWISGSKINAAHTQEKAFFWRRASFNWHISVTLRLNTTPFPVVPPWSWAGGEQTGTQTQMAHNLLRWAGL